METKLTMEQKNALESFIDASSVDSVLEAISEICWEKAEHNSQNESTAIVWARTGNRIMAFRFWLFVHSTKVVSTRG